MAPEQPLSKFGPQALFFFLGGALYQDSGGTFIGAQKKPAQLFCCFYRLGGVSPPPPAGNFRHYRVSIMTCPGSLRALSESETTLHSPKEFQSHLLMRSGCYGRLNAPRDSLPLQDSSKWPFISWHNSLYSAQQVPSTNNTTQRKRKTLKSQIPHLGPRRAISTSWYLFSEWNTGRVVSLNSYKLWYPQTGQT